MKEQLQTFYQKNKIMLFPVVVAVASLSLIILVIYPQIAKLVANQQAYNEVLERSQLLEVKASELESLDEDQLSSNLSLALTALPTDQDLGGIIGVINQVVSNSGFTTVSLSLGQPSNTQSSGSQFGLRVEAIGSRESLDILLNNIESSARVMKVSGVEMSSGKTGGVTVVVSIDVYYQPLPNTIGGVEAPLPKLSNEEQAIIAKLASTIPASSVSTSSQTPQSLGPRGKANPFE